MDGRLAVMRAETGTEISGKQNSAGRKVGLE
jgi:hypothetical protein